MQNGCARAVLPLLNRLCGAAQLHPSELDRNVAIIKAAGIRPE